MKTGHKVFSIFTYNDTVLLLDDGVTVLKESFSLVVGCYLFCKNVTLLQRIYCQNVLSHVLVKYLTIPSYNNRKDHYFHYNGFEI